MSHFTCDLGTRYFPFGQLDRDALSQQLVKSNEDKNEDVPIVSFPLTSIISSGGLGEGTVNNPGITAKRLVLHCLFLSCISSYVLSSRN
jgi:hypothetical protein